MAGEQSQRYTGVLYTSQAVKTQPTSDNVNLGGLLNHNVPPSTHFPPNALVASTTHGNAIGSQMLGMTFKSPYEIDHLQISQAKDPSPSKRNVSQAQIQSSLKTPGECRNHKFNICTLTGVKQLQYLSRGKLYFHS